MSLNNFQLYNNLRKPKIRDTYHEDYLAMQELSFENAPNVYYAEDKDRVEYEVECGSNIFKPVPIVRVDNVVDYNTGLYDTNDFKVLIFMSDFFESNKFMYGSKFKWKDNYWLVINSGTLNGMTNSVEIRRCNNIARFYDDLGQEIYEPCILDITLRFTRNKDTLPITTSNAEQKLWFQRNNNTSFVKPNTRFLFGPKNNRTCWKVYGSGQKNYINTFTENDESCSLTELYMTFDQIDKQRDNLEKGFADARVSDYSIVGVDISGDYRVGDIVPLDFVVYKSGTVSDEPLEYIINNDIAEINNNVISILAEGELKVKVRIKNNINIFRDFILNVVEEPIINYQIKISPNINYVLQNQKKTFECSLYRNGAIDNTVTEFQINDVSINVPQEKYVVKRVSLNSFEIYNKGMFMSKPVIVECSTGEHKQEFSFELRGVY